MGFLRDTENYAWLNQAGPGGGVNADPGGGVVIGPPAPPQGGGGAGGAFPSCASTMNQCPCSYGGCMDNSYMEYDANATCDNGSCATPIVTGCMTPSAINYNPAANMDDGSCIGAVSGCTDPNATNYNAQANTDCSGNVIQGGGGAAQQQQGGNIGFNGYSNAAGRVRAGRGYQGTPGVTPETHLIAGGSNCKGCGVCHPNRCHECDGGGYKCDKGGNKFIPKSAYKNACGNTYSNFNQQGFGGYNDQMWFND